jgi:hypothetical protein
VSLPPSEPSPQPGSPVARRRERGRMMRLGRSCMVVVVSVFVNGPWLRSDLDPTLKGADGGL